MKDKQVKCLPILLALCLSVTGCSETSKKEGYIKAIIKTGLSEREEVLSDPDIINYRVFRDGDNDGVCYEYITTAIRELDPKLLKTGLVGEVKSILDERGKVAIKSGIYLRFIYKSPKGDILGDQIITSSDLGW